MATTRTPGFKSHRDLLLYLYEDLTKLEQVASQDIVLHRFDNSSSPLKGLEAAQAHEEALVAATGGTLYMDVESVVANSHFGAVIGILRAQCPGLDDLAVPFCGLWRFADGQLVEHWENAAADPETMASWLRAASGCGR
ncbi:hypothetical protein GGR57DRAFT_101440 [Xylariaceae sp. FL1272]|nr:hypothetical protein GGR57DRAFT_101440 [Xylariaceae sp. FL1272]